MLYIIEKGQLTLNSFTYTSERFEKSEELYQK